jgi:hypothetical protein
VSGDVFRNRGVKHLQYSVRAKTLSVLFCNVVHRITALSDTREGGREKEEERRRKREEGGEKEEERRRKFHN